VVVEFLSSQTTFSGMSVAVELASELAAPLEGDADVVTMAVEADTVPVLVSVQGA
jgi:hypothetical protein